MAINVQKTIDLDLSGLSRVDKEAAKEEISEYIVDTILDYVSKGESPVSGGKWSELSPEYKKIKAKISGSSKANMELFGDMLDDLSAEFSGNRLKVGFGKDADELSKLKAENHNKFTARSKKKSAKTKKYKVPERNFIPRKTQSFKKEIMRDISNIINDFRGDPLATSGSKKPDNSGGAGSLATRELEKV